MKKLLLLIITTFVSWNVINAQKSELTIDIQTPGWLSSMINYTDRDSVISLKLTGYINQTDLAFVSELIEKHYLKNLDLSEVNIVEGGLTDNSLSGSLNNLILPINIEEISNVLCALSVNNLTDGGPYRKIREGDYASYNSFNSYSSHIKNTYELRYETDTIPDFLFTHEHNNNEGVGISNIILPSTIKYIGMSAFYWTKYKPEVLILPDSLKIIKGAAFNLDNCKEIFIPKKTEQILNDGIGLYNIQNSAKYYMFDPNKSYILHCENSTPPYFKYNKMEDLKNCIVYVPKGCYSAYKNSKYKPKGYNSEINNPWSYATIIEESVYVTSLKLNINNADIKVGETLTLLANIYPENADNKSVNYISEDENIAYVNSTGVITGKKRGVTKIIVTSKENNSIRDTCIVNIIQPIKSILLNKKNLILNVGENETLDVSIFPTDTNNKNLIWNSSDESIATISNTGNLYGIKVGKCKITVYSEENPNIYDTCEIEIKQPVNSLRLDKNEIVSDKIGEIIQLNAIIEPSDATNKNVSWQSSNPSVCSVSSNGSVIILGEGTSVIIATTEDGGFVAICIVNVSFSTGIEIISINNSKNRYFSLDGKEVINPQKGNMYIIIDKNGYSQKVIFK